MFNNGLQPAHIIILLMLLAVAAIVVVVVVVIVKAMAGRNSQPGATATPPQADPTYLLQRLAALRDSGAITQAEYEAKKAEILRRM